MIKKIKWIYYLAYAKLLEKKYCIIISEGIISVYEKDNDEAEQFILYDNEGQYTRTYFNR